MAAAPCDSFGGGAGAAVGCALSVAGPAEPARRELVNADLAVGPTVGVGAVVVGRTSSTVPAIAATLPPYIGHH